MHEPTDTSNAVKALCLFNPLSGKGADVVEALRSAMGECGIEPTLQPLDACDAADFLAREAKAFDRIAVCGGDGTIHALLPALISSGLPFGMVPAGTANDFARSLGLPEDPAAICQVIQTGHTRAVDIGYLGDRPFVNAIQIGIAADVAREHNGWHKKWLGVLGYPISWLRAWRAARPFRAVVEIDGEARHVRASQITLGSGRSYGGGMLLDEKAAIDDGQLRLFYVKPVPKIEWIRLLPRLRRGVGDPEAVHLAGQRMAIRTSRPVRLSVDGEPAGTTPISVSIEPRRLSVYVLPPESDEKTEEEGLS